MNFYKRILERKPLSDQLQSVKAVSCARFERTLCWLRLSEQEWKVIGLGKQEPMIGGWQKPEKEILLKKTNKQKPKQNKSWEPVGFVGSE